MNLLNIFKRKGRTGAALPVGDVGLDESHLELRRAIERCDMLQHAKEAGQVDIGELVASLKRNNFSKATIKKAIEESWGIEVPERLL
ncbi:MAG: hypothetical protein V1723_02830 [Candidatus Uhrbacteria bacterium]